MTDLAEARPVSPSRAERLHNARRRRSSAGQPRCGPRRGPRRGPLPTASEPVRGTSGYRRRALVVDAAPPVLTGVAVVLMPVGARPRVGAAERGHRTAGRLGPHAPGLPRLRAALPRYHDRGVPRRRPGGPQPGRRHRRSAHGYWTTSWPGASSSSPSPCSSPSDWSGATCSVAPSCSRRTSGLDTQRTVVIGNVRTVGPMIRQLQQRARRGHARRRGMCLRHLQRWRLLLGGRGGAGVRLPGGSPLRHRPARRRGRGRLG